MADLIAWLDTQERKPFFRVAPTDAVVEAFDPFLNRLGAEDFAIPDRILETGNNREWKEEELGCVEPENGALQTTSQNLLYRK